MFENHMLSLKNDIYFINNIDILHWLYFRKGVPQNGSSYLGVFGIMNFENIFMLVDERMGFCLEVFSLITHIEQRKNH